MKRIISLLVSMLLMISAFAMPLTVLAEGEDGGNGSYIIDAHFNSQVGERPTWIMYTYEDDRFEIIMEHWYNATDSCTMIKGEGTTKETVFEYGKQYEYSFFAKYTDSEEKFIEIPDVLWDGYSCAETGMENVMEFSGTFTAGYENANFPKTFSISAPIANTRIDDTNYIFVSDDENYVITEQYWVDENGHVLNENDVFEFNVYYTYYVEMEPKEGYKFIFDEGFTSLEGIDWCYDFNGSDMFEGGGGNFKYYVRGTWMSRNTEIGGLNNKVGQSPSWTCDYNEEQFSAAWMEWYNVTDDCYMSENGTTASETIFEEGKEYQLVLTLETNIMPSREFIDVTSINWSDRFDTSDHSANKYYLTFNGRFIAGDQPIGAFDLQFKDPIVDGGNLVYIEIPEDLPVEIEEQFWSTFDRLPLDAKYEAGNSYVYMIILNPKDGYFFDQNFSISGYDWEWTSGSFSSDNAAQVVSVKVEASPAESTEAPEITAAEESKAPETTAVEDSKAPETTAAQSTTQAPTTAASGSKTPATGDANNAFMYILLLAASIIVLGTSVYAVKKNK